jgi:hypothetical protein
MTELISTSILTERTPRQICNDLREHLAGDGTLNDSTTDSLFREYCRVPDGQDTDLEEVEAWAHTHG